MTPTPHQNQDTITLDHGAPIARHPNGHMMLRHPAHLLAFGFGVGLSPRAPGTLATLFAWLSFTVLNLLLTTLAWSITLGVSLIIGVWACVRTSSALNSYDHRAIVWDEILAFWLILFLLAPSSFSTQCWAFLWFRFFDVIKPGPIGQLDRALHGPGWRGGIGIMADDLFAAFFTLLLFALWRAL